MSIKITLRLQLDYVDFYVYKRFLKSLNITEVVFKNVSDTMDYNIYI